MTRARRIGWAAVVAALLFATGCEDKAPPKESPEPPDPMKATAPVEGKRVEMAKNVWLEVLPSGARRVVLAAEVCLRRGQLEQLLTRKGTKEHEAILAADVDARQVHNALLVAGASTGSPVQFDPVYKPASGTRVRVYLVYEKAGRKVQENARTWVRNISTRQELESDWVFAGSILAESPLDKSAPKMYLANEGDVICVANFSTAMLDLPYESSKANDRGGYEAWTERVPAEKTKVSVILEPVVKQK